MSHPSSLSPFTSKLIMDPDSATVFYPTPAPTPSTYYPQAASASSSSRSSPAYITFSVAPAPSTPDIEVASPNASSDLPPVSLSSVAQEALTRFNMSVELWEAILRDAEAHARYLLRAPAATLPSPPSTPAPQAKAKAKHIRRPVNRWLIFRRCVNLSKHLPDLLRSEQSHLSEVFGPCWKSLPKARQHVFKECANKEAEAHRKMYPGYTYQPTRKAEKKSKSCGDVSDERGAKESARERYSQTVAAAGSSSSKRKGKARATASERGVATSHAQHPAVDLLLVPPPQQLPIHAPTAVPPTLPSIRFPTPQPVYYPAASTSWAYSPSTMPSWQFSEPIPTVPIAQQNYWYSTSVSLPVPSAPIPEPAPASLPQMSMEDYSNMYYPTFDSFDWNSFDSFQA
ncbi:hypothetical protein EVJ58_g4375 [Rhodofomes roseus]|uniref:HMG box domain-containing protein n=1 Tax=Rhodofomes roseus TaxID=34475 RepID=A0A4Y9YHP1_9APHY|nr:hypothetical protein EVJ58_g4375 [Rhodofomes roseus]